ncbi:MAG TPA: site-specific integrase, partial [Candidatus Binatia bacterium]|nr:site-specific integrase [Candidatus Binatia bacterium]
VHKGQRYTGCIGAVSRTVAKEEEHRKKTEVIEQRLNPAKARKSPRFDTFAEEYLEFCQANKKPSTYERIALAMTHFVPFFGPKKLNDLTPWHIEQYKKTRKDAGRAPATINLELAFLKTMLRKARSWEKLTQTPEREVRPLKGTAGKTRFLSDEEEGQILGVCSPALRRVVQAGLLTGFRRRELATLRPEAVDFERGAVTVAACYAKNGESRTLPMGPLLKALLQEALAVRGDAPTVFVTGEGKPWTAKGITNGFRKACVRAGMEPLGAHVLRHTFASRLVMAGVDLRTVQELLGHKDIKMTLRYAHLSADHKRQAMETLENRLAKKSPADFHNTPLSAALSSSAKVVALR